MKYMGSKSRIAKYIVPILQKTIDDNNIEGYLDCFCGGCNIIDKIKCKHKIASDKNKYLIALLDCVKNDGELYKEVDKELYDKARTTYNNGNISEFSDWEIGNIGFLASYNGRWFDGGFAKSGYEKTKNGLRYRDYYQEAKNNLLTQAKDLKDCCFFCKDYTEWNPKNIVVYCDPPYQNTKQYANAIKFDYDQFWNVMRKWSENNYVFVSEQNAPNDFISIWEQKVSRSIKASDKSTAVEKLFVYKNGRYIKEKNYE